MRRTSDPMRPNDEYEWCEECDDHHAWECRHCGAATGEYGRCCNCYREEYP